MYIIENHGAARDFNLNGQRYYMGRSGIKRTDDRKFARAMNRQRHVIVRVIDRLDKIVKIGQLRSKAKERGVSLERGDKARDIRAKIRAAISL